MASVVGYARLSTAEQTKGTLTLEQQVARLKEAGAEEVLVDLMTGTTTKRPQYQELLNRIRIGSVVKIIATRWDRICRHAGETCRMVEVLSDDNAPELQLLDDPQDLSTIGGRGQLMMLGVFAQMEAERIRERSAVGKAQRKARGAVDVAPFGMKVVNEKLQPDREEFLSLLSDQQPRSKADLVVEMTGVLEQSLSFYSPWRHLGETYGLWKDRVAIQRLLINPALRGAKVGGRCKNKAVATWADVQEGAGGEPLIEPERHMQLEGLIRGALARKSSPDKRRQHVLAGKVVCAHCGSLMSRWQRNGRNGTGNAGFRCLHQACSWKIPNKRRNSISESLLFPKVFGAFVDQADALAAVEERQAASADELNRNRPDVLKLQAKRQQYLALMADGDAPELQGAVQQMDQQIAALIEAGTNWGSMGMPKLEALRMDSSTTVQFDLGTEAITIQNWDTLTPDQQQHARDRYGPDFPPPDRKEWIEILGNIKTLATQETTGTVAYRWVRDYYGLANREWSDKTAEKEIYEEWDYTVAGGEQDIRPNPRIRLIRELVKEIRVSERNVIGVTLNV